MTETRQTRQAARKDGLLAREGRAAAGAGLRNLGQVVLQAAEAYRGDIAFQIRRGYRVERLTFEQVGAQARQLAGWLLRQGLSQGDRLVVHSPNMPEYALLFFGAWLAGLIVVPLDVRTQPEVVKRFVEAARPCLGFTSRHLGTEFGAPVQQTYILEDLLQLLDGTAPLEPPPTVGPDDWSEIVFTSGTTGMPKGVILTHGNWLAELTALAAAFPLRRGYRALSVLPLSHVLEQSINLLLAYSSGVRMIYLPRVNGATISRALREDQITCFALVPELLRLLLAGLERQVRRAGQWRRWQIAHHLAGYLPFRLRRLLFFPVHRALGGHLQFVGCGGAPLDCKLAEAWERLGVRVFEGYGLTESTGAATINAWEAQRLGSAGRPLPAVELRLAPDGEILLRGPTITPGYLDRPDLTEQTIENGWLHTGDVGYLDTDGFLHVSGRKAFRIVLADGRNVYPEDIERALNEHPLVKESCVVGRSTERGEVVHAVLLTDAPGQAREIVRQVNQHLASHQQITSWSVWPGPDLPRTPILKVDRAAVRAWVEGQAPAAARPAEPGRTADPLIGLIARVSQRAAEDVRPDAELETDLGLDSLERVALLTAIEEELGRAIDETRIRPQTTVAELRRLTEEAPPATLAPPPPRWQRHWWARAVGRLLLWLAFRLQDLWVRLEVIHPERAAHLPVPSLLIFNYQGPYAPLLMLRVIPPHLRERVAVAVTARVWRGWDRWQGWLAGLGAQGFPFATTGGAARASLEEVSRWLDDGYAVIISPEGGPERGEQLRPFLPGTGLLAVELQVPVVPFRIEGYGRLFREERRFPDLPVRRGTVRLTVGEPIRLPPGLDYIEATERLRRAVLEAS